MGEYTTEYINCADTAVEEIEPRLHAAIQRFLKKDYQVVSITPIVKEGTTVGIILTVGR